MRKPYQECERESFFAQVKGEIEGLYRFVPDEVAYLESTGDLGRGDVTPEDLADTVLLRVYREFAAEVRVKAPNRRMKRKWVRG